MGRFRKLFGLETQRLIEHVDIILLPGRDAPFENGMLNGQVFKLDGWPVMIEETFQLGVTVGYLPFWKWGRWYKRRRRLMKNILYAKAYGAGERRVTQMLNQFKGN